MIVLELIGLAMGLFAFIIGSSFVIAGLISRDDLAQANGECDLCGAPDAVVTHGKCQYCIDCAYETGKAAAGEAKKTTLFEWASRSMPWYGGKGCGE